MADKWNRQIAEAYLAALSAGLEAMVGVKPEVSVSGSPGAPPASLQWKQYAVQPFQGSHVWCGVEEEFRARVGILIGEAVGLPDSDPETAMSFWSESWAQVIGSVAASLSSFCSVEVKLDEGQEGVPPDSSAALISIAVNLPSGLEGAVWVAVVGAGPLSQPVEKPEERSESVGLRVLANVELPVTVSFGKAFLSVKDVVKLNTGSIIELNRSISEPVDVKVNNATIARGEVVVVDGNYGIRVLEVCRPSMDGFQARAGN